MQRIPADEATAAYQFTGDGAPQYAAAPPDGWTLVELPVVNPGSGGDSGESASTSTLRYYVPNNEINVTDENAYLPLAVAGYMQVPRGYESELSVGADGGVHDLSALAFDPEFGLVTRTDNYRPYSADGNDWDRFMEIVTIGTISIGTMAIIGPVVVAGMGTSTAGVIAAGAANGVIGSTITTMLQEGEVTFRGLLQAAFSGGMIAGLSTLDGYRALDNLGRDATGATHFTLRAMSITGTATIRGAIQELIGGKFEDGFKQGLVQGLSNELTSYLNAEINAGANAGQITSTQAAALRELTRFTGSAIRAAANPNDPMHAFAQDYLGQLFGPPEVTGNGEVSPAIQAEMDDAALRFRIAVDDEDWGTQRDSINRLLATSQQLNPAQSNQQALNGVLRLLGTDTLPRMLAFDSNGRVRVMDLYVLPTVVVTNRQGPVETLIDDLFGDGTVDRINGGVSGAGRSIFGMAEGVYYFARGGIDGWLNVINIVTGEPIFAESQGRMERLGQSLGQALDNLPNLPAAIREHITTQFERANQLDADGNYHEAAQIRSQLAGDIVQSIANPRSRSAGEVADVMRQIESRLTQSQQARRAFDYAESFFSANPSLRGQAVVHHSIELQVLDKYPGLFTATELNALDMLRGIPNELNNQFHNSALRIEWNQLYRDYPAGRATREQIIQFSRDLDSRYGQFFVPPIKPPSKK